jgi:predicted DNA-binding ribbon-helix-helix protein
MRRKPPLAEYNVMVRPTFLLGEQWIKTSVNLDPIMWQALKEIAAHQDKTASQLVNEIDRERTVGLSAAIRRYVVEFYRDAFKRR